MTNKEKFLALVYDEKTRTVEKIRECIRNRSMLRESQKIALKVLLKLDELGWSQKDLAIELNISHQQVNKIVKGQEVLSIGVRERINAYLNFA